MSQNIQGNISKDISTGIVITILMFTISRYLPIIGFFFSLFIPLPVLFYRSKFGRNIGIWVPLISVVAMLVMSGGITFDVFFLTELLLLGFLLGEFIEKNISVEKTVLYTALIVAISGIFSLIFYSNLSGMQVDKLISQYMTKNFEHIRVALHQEDLGLSPENMRLFETSLDNIERMMAHIIPLLPAIFASFILVVTWMNLLTVKPILINKHLYYPDFGELNRWRAPESLVWGVIGCGILMFLPEQHIRILALSGILILMTIYFFGGIAIISYYLEKKRIPFVFRVCLYSFIALQQFLLLLVILLGFFDMWLNFRRMESNG